MLSDAALALAVGCDPKWLYTGARRTKRALERTPANAVWWRLVHHLADGVGVSLFNAVRAADALVAFSADAGRVRLKATDDETVAVSIDLSRFHDGAALAIAAAMHLAVPKRRGRPRKRSRQTAVEPASPLPVADASPTAAIRLRMALSAVPVQHTDPVSGTSPELLASHFVDSGVEFVIAGSLAAAYHNIPASGHEPGISLDFVLATEGNRAMVLAGVLNALGARPRGVAVRNDFTFDSVLVRASDTLALRIAGVPVNLSTAAPLVGTFPQVRDAADPVVLEGRSYLVLRAHGVRRPRR